MTLPLSFHCLLTPQLLSYLLVSGGAAAVNFLSRLGYSLFVDYALAVTLAYFTGMVFNFALSTRFVFDRYENSRLWRMFIKFAAVAALGLCVTVTVSLAARAVLLYFTDTLSLDLPLALIEGAAHLTGIGTAFIASFLGHNFFTYRNTGLWQRATHRSSDTPDKGS